MSSFKRAILAAIGSAFVTLTTLSDAEPVAGNASALTPGLYENLMLAVSSSGRITGFYSEEQGSGVVKKCAFSLTGRIATSASASSSVLVSDTGTTKIPGTITASGDGVALAVPGARELPGCGLVISPLIDKTLALDAIAKPGWIDLRSVAYDGATMLVAAPFGEVPRLANARPFRAIELRAGEVLGIRSTHEDWLKVDRVVDGALQSGWIQSKSLRTLVQDVPAAQ